MTSRCRKELPVRKERAVVYHNIADPPPTRDARETVFTQGHRSTLQTLSATVTHTSRKRLCIHVARDISKYRKDTRVNKAAADEVGKQQTR